MIEEPETDSMYIDFSALYGFSFSSAEEHSYSASLILKHKSRFDLKHVDKPNFKEILNGAQPEQNLSSVLDITSSPVTWN
jgi:hypothetical protein